MNIAQDWPGMPSDMTSPDQIEKAAQFVAAEPTQERRHRAMFELKAKHSRHVAGMIERRAKAIYRGVGR